jgi:hypothetical protein
MCDRLPGNLGMLTSLVGTAFKEKNALINAGMEMSAQREPDINGRFPRTLRTLACPAGKYGDEKYE